MKIIIILLMVFTSNLFSQGEFLVNTTLDSTQRAPKIAGPDLHGNYAVVWQSFSNISGFNNQNIFIQVFDKNNNKIGNETLVGSTEGGQGNPSIAMQNDGTIVIAWVSFSTAAPDYGFDIKARIIKDYVLSSPEFLVNKTRGSTQSAPDVAIDQSGNIVIVWESWFQDGSDRGIYGQRFSTDGNKSGDEFQINTTTMFSQAKPCVRYFTDGRFIVSWESWTNDYGYDIYAQIFNADGTKRNKEFIVNQYSSDYQWFPSIAVNSDNSFSIAWCSWEQDGDDGGIYLQKFNQDYTRSASEILINSSTANYQWLPRINYLSDGKIAVLWSSWKTDGSREGVYFSIIDQLNRLVVPETKVNLYTDNYQWEPDLAILPGNELMCVWSSWGQNNMDYDIYTRKLKPDYLLGKLSENSVVHSGGRSTSGIKVHILDPAKITGNEYEVSFDSVLNNMTMNIRNLVNGNIPVKDFITSRGENYFYLTDKFDGLAVELNQVYKLGIDTANSRLLNNSYSNVIVRIEPTITGYPLAAPVDIAVIWGKNDTLPDGSYQFPSDTVYNSSMQKEIFTPFRAYNITDNSKTELIVLEKNITKNKRWDLGENVLIRTPAEYRKNNYNTHAQLTFSHASSAAVKYPSSGDTILVKTMRPLTVADKFRFSTAGNNILLSVKEKDGKIDNYWLAQNFPNPFNPVTILRYHIPVSDNVDLRIYDLLGREVKVLLREYKSSGEYSVEWKGENNDGNLVSSGIYIYQLRAGPYIQSRKMVLLR